MTTSSDDELGPWWRLLRDHRTRLCNPLRTGVASSEHTMDGNVKPWVARLFAYSAAVGRPAELADALTDGPLIFEFVIFLLDHRRGPSTLLPPLTSSLGADGHVRQNRPVPG